MQCGFCSWCFFTTHGTHRVVVKQYPRNSRIISAAPSRYLRRDTLVDLCCNSSRPLLQESITENLFSSIAHIPRRLFFQVSLSAASSIYRNPAAAAVLVVHTFYYHSHSVDDPAARFANEFLCDITKRGIFARCSFSLFLSLFVLSTQLYSSYWLEAAMEIAATSCCPSSFFHSNASLFEGD